MSVRWAVAAVAAGLTIGALPTLLEAAFPCSRWERRDCVVDVCTSWTTVPLGDEGLVVECDEWTPVPETCSTCLERSWRWGRR